MPLTASAQNYGSFGDIATAGMYYDEIDIMYPRPFEMLRYSGTVLFTAFGNYRNYQTPVGIANYERYLSWNAVVGDYYAAGVIGTPLWFLNMDDIRSGIFFMQRGGVTMTYDLDSQGGWDTEGSWNSTFNYDDGSGAGQVANDGIIDRTTQENWKDMKYYEDQSDTIINVGTAYPLSKSLTVGLGVNIERQLNILTTEGEKTYVTTIPSVTPQIQNNYKITYPKQEGIDRTSVKDYDLNLSVAFKMSDALEIQGNLITGLHYENNPDGDEIEAADITRSFPSPVDPLKNNTRTETVNTSEWDYDVQLALALGTIFADNIAGAGLTSFEDDRNGFDLGVILRTEYDYDKTVLLIPTVLFEKRFGMSINANKVSEYKFTRENYLTPTQKENYTHTFKRDYSKSDGSDTYMDIGGALKIDFIKLKDVKLAMEIEYNYISTNEKYKETISRTETWTYNDETGVTPQAGAYGDVLVLIGQGTETHTENTNSETEINISIHRLRLPVGTIIPFAKKWKFKVGALYERIYKTIETIRKFNDGQISESYTSTAASESRKNETQMDSYEATSVQKQVSNQTFYSYGIEYNYDENLKIEFNAFLDTGAASILSITAYRDLAISATFRY